MEALIEDVLGHAIRPMKTVRLRGWAIAERLRDYRPPADRWARGQLGEPLPRGLSYADMRALEQAQTAISPAHQIISHLIFVVADDEDLGAAVGERRGDEGAGLPPSG